MMHIEKSFSYQFEDPEWVTKFGLGALISLVPIANFALAGYTVAIVRNVAEGAAEPLPHWDDFGAKFRDGVVLAVAGFIYSAPIWLALLIAAALSAGSGVLANSNAMQQIGHALAGVRGLVVAAVFIPLVLYGIILSLIRPVVLVIYSRAGTLASCFRLREIFGLISRFPTQFVITWVAVGLAALAAWLLVGLVGLLIGWIPYVGWLAGLVVGLGSTLYTLTTDAHLFGQFRVAVSGPAKATGAAGPAV